MELEFRKNRYRHIHQPLADEIYLISDIDYNDKSECEVGKLCRTHNSVLQNVLKVFSSQRTSATRVRVFWWAPDPYEVLNESKLCSGSFEQSSLIPTKLACISEMSKTRESICRKIITANGLGAFISKICSYKYIFHRESHLRSMWMNFDENEPFYEFSQF